MKFYVCGCFFDKYVYLLCKKENGFLTAVDDKLRNGKWCTFIHPHGNFICVCYSYLILLCKIRKHNVDDVIDYLRKICNYYLGNSYISRAVHQSPKFCFESSRPYLKMEEYSSTSYVDQPIDMMCFRCLKHLVVCQNLFSDLCVLEK